MRKSHSIHVTLERYKPFASSNENRPKTTYRINRVRGVTVKRGLLGVLAIICEYLAAKASGVSVVLVCAFCGNDPSADMLGPNFKLQISWMSSKNYGRVRIVSYKREGSAINRILGCSSHLAKPLIAIVLLDSLWRIFQRRQVTGGRCSTLFEF